MATFNGALYLKDQINSILHQNYPNWRLYIRDDDSQDETSSFLRETSQQDNRIVILSDGAGKLGVLNNFSALMSHAIADGADYVMFSDQDDVWDDEKVCNQMSAMKALECEYGEIPVLIHSDMQVVDESLCQLSPSFMAYQGIRHEDMNALHVLLIQNFVTGCTTLANRRLLEIAVPVPDTALMHDWWLALCAATFGKIEYINKPLVKYRQHGSNEVGAKSIKNYLNPFKTNWWSHWLEGRKNLLQSMQQAKVLAERIKDRDPENGSLELIESYASLLAFPRWQRIKALKKNNIHCQSWLRHCLMLSRLLSLPRQANE